MPVLRMIANPWRSDVAIISITFADGKPRPAEEMMRIVSGVVAETFQRPPSVTAADDVPSAVLKSDEKTICLSPDGGGGGGGGGAFTVTLDDPIWPPADALIVAVPAVPAVTMPELDTVATPSLVVIHANVTPLMGVPAESRATADSCAVPCGSSVTELGVTTIDAITGAVGGGGTTGAVTVTFDEALRPPAVAVTTEVPAATPVTLPVLETVATWASLLDQVNVTPLIIVPTESRATAVSCRLLSRGTVIEVGLTATEAITGIGAGGGSVPPACTSIITHAAAALLGVLAKTVVRPIR